MDLNSKKNEILECDKKIAALLEERFNKSLQMANFKMMNNKPITDLAREKEIVTSFTKLINNNTFTRNNKFDFKVIIKTIINISKRIQYEKIYKHNIIIIGFMGVGKTRIGRNIASKTGVNFLDIDRQIEKRLLMKIPDIFNILGEDYFRKIEREIILNISKNFYGIISTGGGSILLDENVNKLKKLGKIFYLKSSPKSIYNNLKYSYKNRPFLRNNFNIGYISKLMDSRKHLYENICDYKIDVDGVPIEEIVSCILKKVSSKNK